MKLGMVEEHAESRKPAGRINALRRVQRIASPLLSPRVVLFRTLYLPLPTRRSEFGGLSCRCQNRAFILKSLGFSLLLGPSSGILREAA
jgi:hypothetical protein